MLWDRFIKKQNKPASEWAVKTSYSSPEKHFDVRLIRTKKPNIRSIDDF